MFRGHLLRIVRNRLFIRHSRRVASPDNFRGFDGHSPIVDGAGARRITLERLLDLLIDLISVLRLEQAVMFISQNERFGVRSS